MMLLTFSSAEFDLLTVTNFKDGGLLGNDAMSFSYVGTEIVAPGNRSETPGKF